MKKLLLLLLLLASPAFATTSTINPNAPVDGGLITAAQLRGQFIAAYNDINTLWSQLAAFGGGVLDVFHGGTGATTAAGARTNLGLSLPLVTTSGGTGGVTPDAAAYNLKYGVQRPTGFNWDFNTYPVNIISNAYGNFSTDFVIENYFSQLSGTQVFVDISKADDSGSGLSSYANAKKTINSAITVGNGLGVPYTVMIKPGTYNRANGFAGSITGTIYPTQNAAFIADGGRVVVGPFDDLTWPTSKDGTYTTLYCLTRSNVNRSVDLWNNDAYGLHNEIKYYSTPAAANAASGGAWNLNGSTLCLKRADGAQPSNSNTRVYLQADNLRNYGNVSLYLGGSTSASGFDLEGGGTAALLSLNSINKNIGGKNSTFRYAGGITAGNSTGRGVQLDNVHGLVAFFNIDTSGNSNDGYNIHNSSNTGQTYSITYNRSGIHNGDTVDTIQLSVNDYTTHENVIAIDINGYGDSNFGANFAVINTTQTWAVGTQSIRAQGDTTHTGGTIPPEQFWTANTASLWCDSCKAFVSQAASGTPYAFYASETSHIYLRNITKNGNNGGGGTISNY